MPTSDNQVGNAGQQLGTPLAVVVKDGSGNPASGVSITWAATLGGGSVTPGTSSTDATGTATTTLTLGSDSVTQHVTATGSNLSGSPVSFTATALIQGATQIALTPANSGNAQTDTVLATLASPYRVILKDETGAVVAGVTVTWATASGSVNGSGTTTTTSAASGVDSVTRTLGGTAGTQTATATVHGLIGSPVTFTSTANPGVATVIAKNGGDNQTGAVNTALATARSVIVHDAHGNVVPNVSVAWAVGVGGGTVSPTNTTTGTNGVASTTRTLGPTVGTQTDTATAALSGSPLVFSATARQPVTVNVSVGNNFFSPADVTVGVGDTVKWTWVGGTTHNVTFQDGPTSGNSSTAGHTFIRVFTANGSFPYECTIHAALGMTGSVTVQ